MKNRFVITGHGRSGTKFLSSVLNSSKKFKVIHEHPDDPKYYGSLKHLESVNNRFKKNYYGEVNSYLRFMLNNIHCEHKYILLRDPYDILRSTFVKRNAKYLQHYENLMGQFITSFFIIDSYIEEGHNVIRFEDLTSNIKSIKNLCNQIGINDIDFSKINLNKKINASDSSKDPMKKMLETKEFRFLIQPILWFSEKYYPRSNIL